MFFYSLKKKKNSKIKFFLHKLIARDEAEVQKQMCVYMCSFLICACINCYAPMEKHGKNLRFNFLEH